ncbi:hypothetical protein OE88DRAFT_1662489 [Heliocybe sulcata]|uniref:GST N-terminal domain-containing protein n=1 Tax=Heliocybe sulcata TaxID=5364 RepID=A0A5C3MY29_9AGAM|nr:hypothetical protein OE88DRAFT_1662489 [Heliocybe sulcata]
MAASQLLSITSKSSLLTVALVLSRILSNRNGDLVIWESNVILLYLADDYDKEGKFRLNDPKDKYRWLMFQASCQVPTLDRCIPCCCGG